LPENHNNQNLTKTQRVRTDNHTTEIIQILRSLLKEGKQTDSEHKNKEEKKNHLVEHLLGNFHKENSNFVKSFVRLSSIIEEGKEDQEQIESIEYSQILRFRRNCHQVHIFIGIQISFRNSVRHFKSQYQNHLQHNKVQQG
jgi:uncharacterized protein YdiU (UPF0061 family)